MAWCFGLDKVSVFARRESRFSPEEGGRHVLCRFLPASLPQVLLTRALCLGQLGQQGEKNFEEGGIRVRCPRFKSLPQRAPCRKESWTYRMNGYLRHDGPQGSAVLKPPLHTGPRICPFPSVPEIQNLSGLGFVASQ